MEDVSIKGVLLRNGRVLFLRNPRGELELPGGRPEIGETAEVTLRRELFEETGATISVDRLVQALPFEVVPDNYVYVIAFRCHAEEQDVLLSDEHTQFRVG